MKTNILRLIVLATTVVMLPNAPAAQTSADDSAVELTDRLAEAPDPTHPPRLDTVLAITNLTRAPSVVTLVGYDKGGNRVGRLHREVPGHGLTYVLASEFVDATRLRFLGKVEAVGRGSLAGTAVLIGGAVTDLPSVSKTRRIGPCPESELETNAGTVIESLITFPVVAAIR